MQRRGAVQHYGMILDDSLKDTPHLVAAALYKAAGALDVRREAALDKLVHDKGLEELKRHLLRKSALVYFEVRPNDDDGTARIVDALSEKVLTEASLLSAQKVRKALERAVAGAKDGLAAASVVDKSVDGFLQHPLFVAHDNLRRFKLLEFAQAVIAVYDPAVEVVKVRRRETPAVELDHRTKIRRDNGKDGEDHPLGTGVALPEILRDLQAFDELALFLARALGDLLTKLVDKCIYVYLAEQRIDALRADSGLEALIVGGTDDLFALQHDVTAHEGRFSALNDDVAGIFYGLCLLGGLETLGIFL